MRRNISFKKKENTVTIVKETTQMCNSKNPFSFEDCGVKGTVHARIEIQSGN